MKRIALVLGLVLVSQVLLAQVILKNEFIINRKLNRLQNKGITMVTVNMGSSSRWNLNAYGQPIKRMDIDIQALLRKKQLTYQETVQRLYQPGAVYHPTFAPVPLFLLYEPHRMRAQPPAFKSSRD